MPYKLNITTNVESSNPTQARFTRFGRHFLTILCQIVLLVVVTRVPRVSNDFCIKTMFGSSLSPVVCRRAHVYLRYLCLLAYSGV
jgi:hypothetical protein